MADINPEIKIHAAPDAVHKALTDPSELSKWHTASTSGKGDTFTTHPNEGPTFEWKILKSAPQSVEWQCVVGPGHSVGTIAHFKLSPIDGGGNTFVEFSHTGWPDSDSNFRKCNTLWAILIFHLQQYLDSGKRAPAFS